MQKRSETTRSHLLDSALKQFAARGYNATSVDDICRGANVSKGAFYHHFESKQALFLDLMNSWLSSIDAALQELEKSTVPDTLVAMTELLPDVLSIARDQLPMYLEFWLQASRDPKALRATVEPYRHFREYFAGLVAEGTGEGTLRKVDPQIAGQVILSMTVGILLQALVEPRRADWQKTAQQGMRILMKGLAS